MTSVPFATPEDDWATLFNSTFLELIDSCGLDFADVDLIDSARYEDEEQTEVIIWIECEDSQGSYLGRCVWIMTYPGGPWCCDCFFGGRVSRIAHRDARLCNWKGRQA